MARVIVGTEALAAGRQDARLFSQLNDIVITDGQKNVDFFALQVAAVNVTVTAVLSLALGERRQRAVHY